jgi:hypothetical protein
MEFEDHRTVQTGTRTTRDLPPDRKSKIRPRVCSTERAHPNAINVSPAGGWHVTSLSALNRGDSSIASGVEAPG